jgi:hypothetical protein
MELRFIGREGETLVFESSEGIRMHAPLDDALRDAVRNRLDPKVEGISPKRVQSEIRAGRSVSEIASDLGVSEEQIAPFAAPILDELRFVLASALGTNLASGERMRPFGELIQEIHPGLEFSIRKVADRWELSSSQGHRWNYDPKARLIEPQSDSAKELSKQLGTARDLIPASRPQPVVQAQETVAVAEAVEDLTEAETATASVHSLVDELKARRGEESVKPASARGRAALPSWDEIVLGTSGLDSNSD